MIWNYWAIIASSHVNKYFSLRVYWFFSFDLVFVNLQVTAKSKDRANKVDTDGGDLAALREESLQLAQEIQALKDEWVDCINL